MSLLVSSRPVLLTVFVSYGEFTSAVRALFPLGALTLSLVHYPACC